MAGGHRQLGAHADVVNSPDGRTASRDLMGAAPPAFYNQRTLPDAQRKIPLYQSAEHRRNFLDSVKSRKPTIAPVDVAHHSTIPGHLGVISMLVGRKLHWDVKQEQILNDPEASALMTRPYRAPYKLA